MFVGILYARQKCHSSVVNVLLDGTPAQHDLLSGHVALVVDNYVVHKFRDEQDVV